MLTYRVPNQPIDPDPDAGPQRPAAKGPAAKGLAERRDAEPMYDLIELFFFAYRDFVGDADRRLADQRFGRAHHRVMHFVSRNPGLTVNELLDILKITKQSLNRVMKDLTDGGLIEVQAGVADRRRRLLHATPRGRQLALDLAHLQSERFRRALNGMPDSARPDMAAFLLNMIDPEERPRVLERVTGASPPARDPGRERAA